MSDEPRVGEFATVVAQHCSGQELVGSIVRVVLIEPPHPSFFLRCLACNKTYAFDEPHAELEGRSIYHPLRWLKRLPPEADVLRYDAAVRTGLPTSNWRKLYAE